MGNGGWGDGGVYVVESTVLISSVILRTPFPPPQAGGYRGGRELVAAFIYRNKSLIYDDITGKSICF